MKEIDRIKLENDMKGAQDTLDLFNNYLKYTDIINGKIEYTYKRRY